MAHLCSQPGRDVFFHHKNVRYNFSDFTAGWRVIERKSSLIYRVQNNWELRERVPTGKNPFERSPKSETFVVVVLQFS